MCLCASECIMTKNKCGKNSFWLTSIFNIRIFPNVLNENREETTRQEKRSLHRFPNKNPKNNFKNHVGTHMHAINDIRRKAIEKTISKYRNALFFKHMGKYLLHRMCLVILFQEFFHVPLLRHSPKKTKECSKDEDY